MEKAGPDTFLFLPHGVPHSYTFETDVVRMLALVAPGSIERHFRDPRFAEPAEAPTLPLPAGPPDVAVLEEMTEDLAGYGTEVVGHLGPSELRWVPDLLGAPQAEVPRTPAARSFENEKRPSTRLGG